MPIHVSLPGGGWWGALLVAALVLVAYWPSLHNGFVDYDDPTYVTKNLQVQAGLSPSSILWAFDPTTRVSANWHPLTLISHMIDCQFYGLNPFGHHLTSVLLHAVNTGLLFFLLQQMTRAFWCSVAVAAAFGLHPAHVESVAWISERKDVLSGLFWMLTLLAYHRYARRRAENGAHARSYYILALSAFALGLLAKPMLVTLPFVLLLLDYWPLQRLTLQNLRGLLIEKVPFFVLTLASCWVTFAAQRAGGAMDAVESIPFAQRSVNALVAYLRYTGMLLWPSDLVALYPFEKHWPLAMVVGASLFVVSVSVLVLWFGRERGYLPVGWLWFLGTLVPVIGLVQVGMQSIADRYTYLPSIGLFLLLAWGGREIFERWRIPAIAVGTIGAVTTLTYIVATRHQTQYWYDGETVFRRVLAKYDNYFYIHLNLGISLLEKRRFPEAIAALERARQLSPGVGVIHLHLSAALLAEGRIEDAVRACRETTRLEPKMLSAWTNLGRNQIYMDDVAGAIDSFQRAVELAPKDPKVHHLLGVALRAGSRYDAAIQAQRRALEFKSDFAAAREELIKGLIQKGSVDEARIEWRRISGLEPNSLVEHNSFGVLLAEIGQIDAATKEFEAAHRLAPNDVDAKNNLERANAAKASVGKGIPEPKERGSLP